MDPTDLSTLTQQFNQGAPVPPVNPADMQQMWNAMRELGRLDAFGSFGSDQSTETPAAIGAGALGFDQFARGPNFAAEFFAISNRHALLDALVAR